MKTVLRRSLKGLGYLLCVVVLLALAFYAWVVIANWNDAPLSDGVKRALQYTPPTDAQLQDNGFLIFLGLDAPFSQDDQDAVSPAVELGRQHLAREIERHAWVQTNPNTTEGIPPTIDGAKGESEILSTALRCPPGEADCFTWYQQHRADIKAQISRYQPLLQRANAAAQAKQFSNPLPFYLLFDLPPYAWLTRTQELNLALATLQWLDGRPEKAIATAVQTSLLRQRLAESSNSLVTSSVALAMQYRELRWLSNATNHITPQTPSTITSAIDQMLLVAAPNLSSAIDGEKQFAAGVYASLQGGSSGDHSLLNWNDAPGFWERLWNRVVNVGFLHGETVNATIQDLEQIQAISQLPADQQNTAFAHYQTELDAVTNSCGAPWQRMRNAVGSCLIGMSASVYGTYLQRVTDINGFRRLVQLQRKAMAESVTAADMPAWLNQSPPELRDPYTLGPMQWDAASNSLVFEGKAPQNQHPDESRTYRVRLLTSTP